jgi:proteasome lid subunit RPN8/RPN11
MTEIDALAELPALPALLPRPRRPEPSMSDEELKAEMESIARKADPAWFELLELASSPLPELELEDYARYGHRPPNAPLEVPRTVLAAIRNHATAAKPGHEICGELLVHRGVATGYRPLRNVSARPGHFETGPMRRTPGAVFLHSHAIGPATPSMGDLEGASARSLRRYAIYSAAADELALFRIAPDRSSFTPLPLEIVDGPAATQAMRREEGPPTTFTVVGRHIRVKQEVEAREALEELYRQLGLEPPPVETDDHAIDPPDRAHLSPHGGPRETQARRVAEAVEVRASARPRRTRRTHVSVRNADHLVRWLKAQYPRPPG